MTSLDVGGDAALDASLTVGLPPHFGFFAGVKKSVIIVALRDM